LALSSARTTSGTNTVLLTTVLLWVLVTILFVVMLGGGSESDSGDEPSEVEEGIKSPAYSFSPRMAQETYCSPAETIKTHSSPSQGNGSASKTPPEQNKDALELCLRCEIFSAQEYSNNRISQEHVDECLWIANTMLQQMSLDDWVDLSDNERQSFEDRVDALLSAMPLPPAFGTPLEWGVTPPASRGSLKRTSPCQSSSVSLGSEVSFRIALEPHTEASTANYAAAVMTVTQTPVPDPEWVHLQDTRPLPEKFPAHLQDTRPLPEKMPAHSQVPDKAPNNPPEDKSPVPMMNCGDEAALSPLSSVQSTRAEDEGVFSSIFGSSAQTSPQESQRSSPLENAKVPNSGYTVPSTAFSNVPNSSDVPLSAYEGRPSLRLSPREVMAPPPQSMESPGSRRNSLYDNGSPRELLGSMSVPSIRENSPRGILASKSATSIREMAPVALASRHPCGSSGSSSRIPLLSETPDLAQHHRLPGPISRPS